VEPLLLFLSLLSPEPPLVEAACIRAQEAAVVWAHIRPTGEPWWAVVEAPLPGHAYAELLADGPQPWDGWLASPPHRLVLEYPIAGYGFCRQGTFAALYVRVAPEDMR